jgi:hypothetical protein
MPRRWWAGSTATDKRSGADVNGQLCSIGEGRRPLTIHVAVSFRPEHPLRLGLKRYVQLEQLGLIETTRAWDSVVFPVTFGCVRRRCRRSIPLRVSYHRPLRVTVFGDFNDDKGRAAISHSSQSSGSSPLRFVESGITGFGLGVQVGRKEGVRSRAEEGLPRDAADPKTVGFGCWTELERHWSLMWC